MDFKLDIISQEDCGQDRAFNPEVMDLGGLKPHDKGVVKALAYLL